MEERFDFSYGALYLTLVFAGYAFVGALGAFTNFPPLPALMALFLMVNPYPLLHAVGKCTVHFPCTTSDIIYEFPAMGTYVGEFMPISVFVLFFGLLGLIAVFIRVRAGRQALLILITFLTVAGIWNWIDFALAVRKSGPYLLSQYWVPTIHLVWLASYWLAFSRIKLHGPRDEKYW